MRLTCERLALRLVPDANCRLIVATPKFERKLRDAINSN